MPADPSFVGELLSLVVFGDGDDLGFCRRFNFGPTFEITEEFVTVGTERRRQLNIDLVGGDGIASSVVGPTNNVAILRGTTLATGAIDLVKLDNLDALTVGHATSVTSVDLRALTSHRLWIGAANVATVSASEFTWAAAVAGPVFTQAQAAAGAGQSMVVQAQFGQAGANRGGHLLIAGGEAGTAGSAKAGDTIIDLGAPETAGDTTARLAINLGNVLGTALDLTAHDASAYALTLTAAGAFVITTAGALSINGAPHARTVIEVNSAASPYTLTAPNCLILVDSSAGNVTINMPTAVGVNAACSVEIVHNVTGNDVALEGNGGETVGGVATYDMSAPLILGIVLRPAAGNWVKVASAGT